VPSLDEKGSPGYLLVFAPGGRGGAQRHTDLLVETLCAKGWRVRMVVRQTYASRFRVRRRTGLLCFEVPGFGGGRLGVALYLLVGVLVAIPWARRARAAFGVQLAWPATAAALAGWLCRVPFIAFSTGSGELSDVCDLRLGRSSPIRVRLIEKAAWLVAQTQAGAREAAGFLPSSAITVVPNPVKRSWAPLHGTPTVAFAGRLAPEKEVETLLEAWRIIVLRRPEARLLIAGDSDGDSDSRSTAARVRSVVEKDPSLRSTVTLLGWVDQILAVVTSCDLFVFPSRTEGMSNALLEAMACGRVVVASDIAANRAVVGDAYPFLFPVGDVDSLASAIRGAMTDGRMRQVALRQLEDRLDAFSPQRVGALVEDLIESAHGRPHRRRRR
jgi:glycosyltransferase involved in cell wall biosynthesis